MNPEQICTKPTTVMTVNIMTVKKEDLTFEVCPRPKPLKLDTLNLVDLNLDTLKPGPYSISLIP